MIPECLPEIARIQYINILIWLRSFQDKLQNLVLFSLYPSLLWELTDTGLEIKKMSGPKFATSYENLVATLKMLVVKLIEAI